MHFECVRTDLESAERVKAIAALPEGCQLVEKGCVIEEDLTWDFMNEQWTRVTPPLPFVKGQKRPGFRQMTDIGKDVAQFVAVARKQTVTN